MSGVTVRVANKRLSADLRRLMRRGVECVVEV